ncbi:unnamed protein product [Chrysoparadoxa australica]
MRQRLRRKLQALAAVGHRLESFKAVNRAAVTGLIAQRASPLSTVNLLNKYVDGLPLFDSTSLEPVLETIERHYASAVTHGDCLASRVRLVAHSYETLQGASRNRSLWRGLQVGTSFVLLVWLMWDCVMDDSLGVVLWMDPAFKVYRAIGNLVLLVWLWAGCVMVWESIGVDWRRCFGLGPASFSAPSSRGVASAQPGALQEVAQMGCDLTSAYLLSFLCFYKAIRGVLISPQLMPSQFAHTFPLMLLCYTAQRLILPWARRKDLFSVIWRVMLAPMRKVSFIDGYIGDILTSTVRVSNDLAFTALYYLAGVNGWLANDLQLSAVNYVDKMWAYQQLLVPLFTVVPLWIRFQQTLRSCYDTGDRWPHLGNSAKYALAIAVSLFGGFQPGLHNSLGWICWFVGATLYQFFWDVTMDWGIVGYLGGSLTLSSPRFLPQRWYYQAAIVMNLLLRFCWTVTLIPEGRANLFTKDFQAYLSPFVAAAEIARRSMWGVLRVENEYIRLLEETEKAATGCDSPDKGDLTSALENQGFVSMEIAGPSASGQGHDRGQGFSLRPWRKGSEDDKRMFLAELCAYTAILGAIALAAAAG